MANLREIKKDIDNKVFEIVSDCLVFSQIHPDVKTDDVASIVEDAVSLRNDLFTRVNSPEAKGDPGLVRKHFRTIKKDLAENTDKLCQRLSDISKKKAK